MDKLTNMTVNKMMNTTVNKMMNTTVNKMNTTVNKMKQEDEHDMERFQQNYHLSYLCL